MLLTLFDSLLCSSRTYSELTKNLISALKVSGLKEKNCAAKLYEYCYIDESKGFLAEAEKLKSLIAQKLEGISPASFTVSGRKKAFRSHVKKLWSRYPDLDRVKDEYAFRIIISDKLIGKESAIRFCYIFTKTLIDFFLDKNFLINSVKAKQDGELPSEINAEITIPERPYISEEYFPFIKDYIFNPKSNGYQGLHIIIKDPKTKREFEIQIRTDSMHRYAEIGNASHDISYKPKDNMNYKRINISGFACDESGNIVEDIHGIINPLPIGKISKYEVSNDPITWDV